MLVDGMRGEENGEGDAPLENLLVRLLRLAVDDVEDLDGAVARARREALAVVI